MICNLISLQPKIWLESVYFIYRVFKSFILWLQLASLLDPNEIISASLQAGAWRSEDPYQYIFKYRQLFCATGVLLQWTSFFKASKQLLVLLNDMKVIYTIKFRFSYASLLMLFTCWDWTKSANIQGVKELWKAVYEVFFYESEVK